MGKGSSSMSLQGLCMVGALQLLWLLSLLHGASAQNSNCSQTTLTTLLPCLNYIEAGITTKPGSDCCTPLGSLLTANPTCICQIAPLAQQNGFTVNQTRALEVATECGQTVPASVTSCLSGVGSSPLGAPSGSSGSPSPPGTPAGGTDGGSHGSALFPPTLLIASIFVALSLHLGMST